jgi:hypothetical protein
MPHFLLVSILQSKNKVINLWGRGGTKTNQIIGHAVHFKYLSYASGCNYNNSKELRMSEYENYL